MPCPYERRGIAGSAQRGIRIVMARDGGADPGNRGAQIAAVACVGVLERSQAVRVQLVVQNHGVVERLPHEVGILIRAPSLLRSLGLNLGEQLGARRRIDAARVGRLQARDRAVEQGGERQRVGPSRRGHVGARSVVAVEEEELGAPEADEIGERFVERCLTGYIDRTVQELMDDRLRQPLLIVAQERAEQRIVEPSQGAERDRGTHVRVIALRVELGGEPIRVGGIEIGPVRHAADDREPPRVGLQPVARSGADDVHDLARVDGRDRAVAAADIQPEIVCGEAPHRQGQLQFGARVGVDVAYQHAIDRLAAPQQAGLFIGSPQHVAGGATRRGEGEEGSEYRCRVRQPARAPHDEAAAGRSTGDAAVPGAYWSW
jgi:hypothetical protein